MNKVVVVTATWCGPCKTYKPIVEEVTPDIESKGYEVEYVVGDLEPDKASQLGVRGVPTTIVYKNGVETARLVGGQTKEALLKEL